MKSYIKSFFNSIFFILSLIFAFCIWCYYILVIGDFECNISLKETVIFSITCLLFAFFESVYIYMCKKTFSKIKFTILLYPLALWGITLINSFRYPDTTYSIACLISGLLSIIIPLVVSIIIFRHVRS